MGIPVLGPDVNEIPRDVHAGVHQAVEGRASMVARPPLPSGDPSSSPLVSDLRRRSFGARLSHRLHPLRLAGIKAWASRPPSASWLSAPPADPSGFPGFLLRADSRGSTSACSKPRGNRRLRFQRRAARGALRADRQRRSRSWASCSANIPRCAAMSPRRAGRRNRAETMLFEPCRIQRPASPPDRDVGSASSPNYCAIRASARDIDRSSGSGEHAMLDLEPAPIRRQGPQRKGRCDSRP